MEPLPLPPPAPPGPQEPAEVDPHEIALPPSNDGGSDGDEVRDDSDREASLHAMSSFSIGLSIDSDDSDANSSLGDMDRPSSSISVSSSVYHFIEEFGRTFHRYKEGKYYLPNDEQEQSRLDLQHALATRILEGKLNLAPVQTLHRVLDIGTGTGIWAIEFAEQHPEADVLATDLSPIQPEYVPPNCRFEIDDIEDDWIFSHSFDYIHGRYIVGFLNDVPSLLTNIYNNLNPGGYVEFMETLMLLEAVDDSLKDHPLRKWNNLMVEGVRKTRKDPLAAVNLKRWLADAGFINVTEKKTAVPANPWAKGQEQKIRGAMMMTNLLEVAQGITMSICTKVHGWSTEQVELFLVEIRAGLKDKSVHGYVPVISVWAQKPEY